MRKHDMTKHTRRQILTGAASIGLTAFPAIRRSAAAASRKLKFTLPWVAEGSTAYIYVAKAKGFWEEAGLDVEITRGNGSSAAGQAVAAGRFDFGVAVTASNIALAAKKLPIIQIASDYYDSSMGLAVMSDSPIQSPKDLEGRRLGVTMTSGDYPFLPAFAKIAGIDLKKVDIVQADANVRQSLLTERKVDAITGFGFSILPTAVAKGTKIRFVYYKKYGLNFYGDGLITSRAMYEKEPETCQAITQGLIKALQFSLLQPQAALDLLFREVPELGMSEGGKTQAQFGIGLVNRATVDPVARTNGLGFTDMAEWGKMVDLVMEYASASGDQRPTEGQAITNEFVGKVKLTPAEWDTAESNAANLTKDLSL
jgi:NitT/TauT family transport system substrate-binding protein